MITNKNKWVVFDLDEVLVNTRHAIQNCMLSITGKDIHWRQWNTYDLVKIYGGEIGNILSVFEDHKVIEQAILEPGAKEAITHCKEMGYKVAIVTARGWHSNGMSVTEKLLSDNNINIDELRVVSSCGSKNKEMLTLGEISYFLDDHGGHIASAHEAGIVENSILRDRPWNQDYFNYKRVNNLFEFMEIVK